MEYEAIKTILNSKMIDEIDQNGKNGYYLSYKIKKKSGKYRWIDAPQLTLKDLQYQILERILCHIDPHPAAVGFREGHSMTEGADKHLGCAALLNMDLKDFFNSIDYNMALRTLTHVTSHMADNNFTPEWNNLDLRMLTNLVTYKTRVPQGAPTSPALSNLVARHLDRQLHELAESYGMTYTRYADDLSFSHPTGDMDLMDIYVDILKTIKRNEFRVNSKKTRMQRPHQRMSVTGIVVNEKKSVPKWKWRQFRAKLHNLEKSQEKIETGEYQKILGYAEWIRQLHPKRGQRFLDQIGKLNYVKS